MPKYYIPKMDFKVVGCDEIKKYIDSTDDKEMKILIALAWLFGARLSELLSLKKKDFEINKEEDSLYINIITLKTKDKRMRKIVLSLSKDKFVSDLIVPYVQSIENGDSKLFSRKKRTYQLKMKKLNELLHGSNTNNYITFHYLRHSAITHLARNCSASIYEIKSVTGHSSSAFESYIIMRATERFKGKYSER